MQRIGTFSFPFFEEVNFQVNLLDLFLVVGSHSFKVLKEKWLFSLEFNELYFLISNHSAYSGRY